MIVVAATSADGVVWALVGPEMAGFGSSRPWPRSALRGLDACRLRFEGCRVPARSLLGGAGRP